MRQKQEMTEKSGKMLNLLVSAEKSGKFKVASAALSPDDIKRRARNERKRQRKIKWAIIPIPRRAGNPKKDKEARRSRPQDYRNKLGVYVPFVLLNASDFPTRIQKDRPVNQQTMNIDLIRRAHRANRDGGYHNINAGASRG